MARRHHIEALGKITSGVAHDFNTLMTIVQQAMGLLRRKPALGASPEMMMLVDEADEAARLGGQITQQLLGFARQKPMRPEIVLLAEFMEQQRPLFERSLGESMTLTIRAGSVGAAIRADPGQLTTALINLLVNARDAMQGAGNVDLGITEVGNIGRDRRWQELPAGHYVAITVTDRGQGMTPDIVRQAVTPFFTTKSDAGGSGLGLSSVDGFVSQSGGALDLDSQPGAGTTVTMLFPGVVTSPAS
jgi:signal transduction histidine kinase